MMRSWQQTEPLDALRMNDTFNQKQERKKNDTIMIKEFVAWSKETFGQLKIHRMIKKKLNMYNFKIKPHFLQFAIAIAAKAISQNLKIPHLRRMSYWVGNYCYCSCTAATMWSCKYVLPFNTFINDEDINQNQMC